MTPTTRKGQQLCIQWPPEFLGIAEKTAIDIYTVIKEMKRKPVKFISE